MLETKDSRTFLMLSLFLITAAICLSLMQSVAFAAEKVDQSNLPEWGGGWTHINPNPNGHARMWQTFTPNYSNITAVEIDILTVNAGDFDDIITIEIAKDGDILASVERNVEYGFEGLLRFEFAKAVAVVPGELYELKVHDTGLTRFGWRYASNTYDAGSRYVSTSEHPGTDWFFQTYSLEPHIIYVDDDAAGANNGTSWENAFTFLQDALTTTRLPDVEKPLEILVAQGTYKPNEGLLPIKPGGVGRGGQPYPPKYPADLAVRATFQLINGVTLRGGYAGINEPDPNARDVKLYESTLSGDLNDNDMDIDDPCDLFNVPNRHDNSWNVVTGNNTNATATLDGFTITRGYTWVVLYGGSFAGGAGMLIFSGSPALINCTFTENVTGNSGGGLLIYGDSNPTLYNCKFSRNYADGGGGICNGRNSSPTIINCTFSDNYARYEGGAMFNGGSNPKLTVCTFSNNSVPDNPYSVSEGGGAMRNSASNVILTDCTFCDNIAGCGAGMYNDKNSILKLTNCTFRANLAKQHPGGGMFNEDINDLVLIDCIFSGNSATFAGGGMFNRYSNVLLKNCIFSGNRTYDELRTNPPYILPGQGGGLFAFGNTTLINCTFRGNWAQKYCTISKYTFSDISMVNCILWDGGNEVIKTETRPNIIYSNIQGGWEGEGNNAEDPLFVNPGYWADADDPNIVAEPNDPNAVWIDGDYHLKSEAGRWDLISQSWVIDDVTSPCIDGGDPNSLVEYEPEPNGGRINMGAYGGTAEASKSYTSELFQTNRGLIRVFRFKAVK